MFTGNYLRWVFLILLCIITHATLLAQTFQVAGGIPYFPAYTNAASVTLSPIPTGAVIYDKSKSQLQLYTGSAWVSLCSANIPSTSNVSASFRIVKGIPVLSVTNLSTTATVGATYLKTTGGIYVGDGSAWNALGTYMNKTNVTTTNPARMGAVAGAGSAIVIPVLSTAPTATAAGAAYFDATTANLKVYSGTAWLTVGCNLPFATSVTTSGSFYSNNTITGSYTYNQIDPVPQGSSSYRWYSADNSSGSGKTLIGTSISYSIPSTIAGKYIAFGVIPVTNTGLTGTEVLSTWKLVQWQCGDNLKVQHSTAKGAPNSAQISYETMYESKTGKCWILRNLGATTQASGPNDNSAAAAGWYWQFGQYKGVDGNGSPTSNWASTTPSGVWSASNDPCTNQLGAGWYIPTKTQWDIIANTFWSVSHAYNQTKLKLHAAGIMSSPSSSSIAWRGNTGFYWCGASRYNSGWAHDCYMNDRFFNTTDTRQVLYGASIRCVK